ncbi:MAG: hypothetical protein JWM82_4296 [Myxococcales bacterium]|nr:hypothetical protein [Myxococcales bacterium]
MSKRRLGWMMIAGAALGAGVMAGGGCHPVGASGGCEQLGDCGGNPTGDWVFTSEADTCAVPQAVRPSQNYANTFPQNYQPETTAPAPAQTSGPWCWDLMFNVDPTTNEVLPANPGVPQPLPPDTVVSGTISFNADNTYLYKLTATSQTPFHIARSCLGVLAKDLTCAEVGKKIEDWGFANNPAYKALADKSPSFQCHDAGDGCDCSFTYTETDQLAVGDAGRWVQEGNVIHHYSLQGNGNLFADTSTTRRTLRDATFCASPDGKTLELSGTRGQPLALKAGLRTIKLTRVVPVAGADAAAPLMAAPEAGIVAEPDAGPGADAFPDDAGAAD